MDFQLIVIEVRLADINRRIQIIQRAWDISSENGSFLRGCLDSQSSINQLDELNTGEQRVSILSGLI